MASIFDFGTGFARLMAASAALSLAASAPAPAQPASTSVVKVEISGLRDARGLVRLCLTRDPEDFPDCRSSGVVHATIKAAKTPLHHEFRGVPRGTYAVAAFHDANGDGKLNTMFGIPTEGFAFSRNPKMHARAPRFNEASFDNNGTSLAPLKMKYLL